LNLQFGFHVRIGFEFSVHPALAQTGGNASKYFHESKSPTVQSREADDRAALHRLLLRETFPLELELHHLDCRGSHGDLEHYHFWPEQAEKLKNPPDCTGMGGKNYGEFVLAVWRRAGKVCRQIPPFRDMKTNFLKVAGLIVLAIGAGCSPVNPPATEAPPSSRITIRGSNTVGEELAPRLIAEYKTDHPKAVFDLEAKGTAYGFGALAGAFCDIAGASRPPSKDEMEVIQHRNVELNDHVIGAYSVTVVVNAANPVATLTKEQVRDLFTGVITNWSAVGGLDAPVDIYARDPISGTYLGYKELAMENQPYAPVPNLFTNYEGIVTGLAADANGIGYSSVALAGSPGVKAVSIGGVAPTAESIQKGLYPYARQLHLYTSKGHESSDALDFIQFVLSDRGQKIVAKAGDTPLR
jgi:phosphate transport system substrate-binding protein